MTGEEIMTAYLDGLKDEEIRALAKILGSNDATYEHLYRFADKTSKKAAKAFKMITGDTLSIEEAEELIRPLLTAHADMIAQYAGITQAAINKVNEVPLQAVSVTPSKDRIDGILKKVCSGNLEDTSYILSSGTISFAKAIIDETCRMNAEQQYKAGLTPVITRKTGPGGCCKWCQQWAGTWTYPDVPQEVYMRHRDCDCIVEYKNGRMKQNVHTKQWSNLQPSEIVKQPGGALSYKQAEDYEQYLKQKKRNDAINALAKERGITYEKAAREYHLASERLRDRDRYYRGQRRNWKSSGFRLSNASYDTLMERARRHEEIRRNAGYVEKDRELLSKINRSKKKK